MKTSILATASLSLLAASAFAGTPSPKAPQPVVDAAPPSQAGFFIGAEGGGFWLNDVSAGSLPHVDVKFKDGYGYDVPVGYDFGNGLSLGVSAGYDKADFKSVTGSVGGSSQSAATHGEMQFIPVMGNLSYSVKLVGNLSWNIGAGAGAVRTRAKFTAFDSPADRSITFGQLGGATSVFGGLDDTRWDFGFQAFSGLSYEIVPGASINVGYHYLRTNDKMTVNGDSASDFSGHMAVAGFVWKF
ncbi:MAG: pagN [Verrucomicrobiaceae bacterium]|nr:pagN [Verrucomicrobiaceae bacterium]